ncbi:MAG: hypothetical protein QOK08_1747 [Actinomycetota bacterium]|nr:hypothetical protein [Actinomycetota bacterium]
MIFNWWGLLIFLAVMGTVTAIAVRGRGNRPAFSGVPSARITRIIAVLYSLVAAIGTVITVLQTLLSSRVSVSMPVQQFWPSLPSAVKEVQGVSAHVAGGGFSTAHVDVTGLDAAARTWLAAGELVQGSTTVLIGVVVVILCTSVIRQNPFRPVLMRGISFSAFGILIGGLVWQICGVVGGNLASNQVLGVNGWGLDTANVRWDDIHNLIGLPEASHEWNIDLWPLWIGLSLLAVSAVFRYGHRLQKETDGLI